MRFQPTLAKVSFWAFVIALVIALGAGFGTRLGVWGFQIGLLKIFPWALGIGAIALLAGAIWAITALVKNDSTGSRFGIIGLAGAVVMLALPVYSIYVAKTAPPIHDISTDTENPPQFKAVLPLRKGATNKAEYDGAKTAAAQRKYYGDIRSFAVLIPPKKLFERAHRAAEAMGWNIVAVNPDEGRIEATDTTLFFGFTDDIVIRVKPAGMGARLDIRSKSRVGVSDVGKNAARIRAFFEKLKNTK